MYMCRTRGPKEAHWWTDSQAKSVSIRYGDTGASKEPAETIMSVFQDIVCRYGDDIALAVKRSGKWDKWTYRMYWEESWKVARAFIHVGLWWWEVEEEGREGRGR